MVDAYWNDGDQAAIDGPGAESFIELLKRAKVMLDRLAACTADNIMVFSHGQFIRAVAWFIRHGEAAGTPENMRLFRELDTKDPLPNCAGYDLELRDGRWEVVHQIAQDGEVKFIDKFCTDQGMAPIPLTVMTRGVVIHSKLCVLARMIMSRTFALSMVFGHSPPGPAVVNHAAGCRQHRGPSGFHPSVSSHAACALRLHKCQLLIIKRS